MTEAAKERGHKTALEGTWATAPALPARDALDLLPEGVLLVDAAGQIAAANRRLEEMFGYAAGELTGRSVESLLPDSLRDLHAAHRDGYNRHPRRREAGVGFELVGLRKNGREFPVEVALGPAIIAEAPHVAAVVSDISERKWAEEAVTEVVRRTAAEERRSLVMQTLPDAVLVIGRDGIIVDANARAEQVFGYSPGELAGRPVTKLAPRRQREELAERLAAWIADPAAAPRWSVRSTALRKDGSEFPVETSAWRTVADGEPQITLVARDATERRDAEVELQLMQDVARAVGEAAGLESALQAALDVICRATGWVCGEAWVPRADGCALEPAHAWFGTGKRLQGFREAGRALTFEPGEGLPGRVWAAGTPEWIPDVSAAPAAVFSRARAAEEARLHVALGVPLVAGGEVLAVIVFYMFRPRPEDHRLVEIVTAAAGQLGLVLHRKKLADDLRELNAELESRVALRTAELEAANRELEAFSYSVSHDLRAPLRAVDGFSQALIEDYGDRFDEAATGYVDRIRSGVQRMGDLIDALLNLSHVTRSELRRERVDLSRIAAAVARDLKRRHPTRRVTFRIRKGVTATADPRLMMNLMENLLGNAWKFTSRLPHAHIEFGTIEKDGATAYCVRDDGAGFDMRYVDKLFRAFQRLHGASEFPGTGVGLATVQRIVHRHGGRVWAEGQVEKGAAFCFTLGAVPGLSGRRKAARR